MNSISYLIKISCNLISSPPINKPLHRDQKSADTSITYQLADTNFLYRRPFFRSWLFERVFDRLQDDYVYNAAVTRFDLKLLQRSAITASALTIPSLSPKNVDEHWFMNMDYSTLSINLTRFHRRSTVSAIGALGQGLDDARYNRQHYHSLAIKLLAAEVHIASRAISTRFPERPAFSRLVSGPETIQ